MEKVEVKAQSAINSKVSNYPSLVPRDALVVGTICASQFLNAYTTGSVAIALPTLAKQFSIPPSNLEWPNTAMLISFGGLLLLCGRLADIYGRRRMFSLGSLWFAVFSVFIGFSQSEIWLILGLGLLGIGGAMNIPAGMGLLSTYFPDVKKSNVALSFFGAMNPLGAVCGNVIGGVLTEKVSWRVSFFLGGGLSLASAVGALLLIPATLDRSHEDIPDGSEDYQSTRPSVDWIGGLLITSSIVLLTFALSDGSIAPSGFATWYIVLSLVVVVPLIVVFIYFEAKIARDPLLPMGLWRIHNFGKLVGLSALVQMGFQTFALHVPLVFQNVNGYSPLEAAFHFIPMTIQGFIVAVAAGFIVSVYKVLRPLIVGGLLIMISAAVLLANNYVSNSYWEREFPALVLIVTGFDIVFNVFSIGIVSLVHLPQRSLAAGVFSTAVNIGSAVGLALSSTVSSSIIRTHPIAEDGVVAPEVYAEAYRAVYWMSAAAMALAALVCTLVVRGSLVNVAYDSPLSGLDEEVELGADK
ncbi:hypothetical protein HDU93_000394 [Gonapodya sp. JEL0774]|nr:hypothetical protein HDU93_000394 [Gonapodya sp. JEL0774]